MTQANHIRVVRETSIELVGSIDTVFPLFEPENERKWVDGWDPTVIFPTNETIEEDLVFTTEKDGQTAVWTMIRYDQKRRRIEYNKVEPRHIVIHVSVECKSVESEVTTAIISYTMTALSPDGEKTVGDFTEDHYVGWIGNWKKAINHFLETGTRLTSTDD